MTRQEVTIRLAEGDLGATLTLPASPPRGIIVFAHGSGSSRFSPRNRYVADELTIDGFATLLTDLLTPAEERVDNITAQFRFDVELLASRLLEATKWLKGRPALSTLPVGYFGASTGAAAALIAAAESGEAVKAIVSRGGRPDLAGDALLRVTAPTLLIVGGNDPEVIDLNRRAQAQMTSAERELVIVPGAGHLFEELGALEHVANLAKQWFDAKLAST